METWQIVVGGLLILALGLVLGVLLVRRFGEDWIAMLCYIVGPKEVKFAAQVLWQVLLCNNRWAKLRWHNEEGFVLWISNLVDGLRVQEKVMAIRRHQVQRDVPHVNVWMAH